MKNPIIPWIGGKRVERGELVIYSWDRQQDHAGLFA